MAAPVNRAHVCRVSDRDRFERALEGRYRLIREIGSGGAATVLLAEDLKHQRQVAIKVLHPEVARALGPERFLREIGFECGGDDYITKPFSPRELVARVKAALRKQGDDPAILRFGDLEIDTAAMLLRVRGVEKTLTTVEFRILEMLARSPGRVFSRERILRTIGSDAFESSPRAVDTFISKIRARIEDDPRSPAYLLTIRGAGYRFAGR